MASQHKTRQGERGFALLLIVFSVTAFWQSYAISGFAGLSTAGIFPMLASATMVFAAVFILIDVLRMDSPHAAGTDDGSAGTAATILPLRLVILLVLITAYVIAMPTLGFLVASGLFLFVAINYLWRRSVIVSLAVTLVSLMAVYLIFRKLFQVVLPEGTLLRAWF